jgi:hypothetical protein
MGGGGGDDRWGPLQCQRGLIGFESDSKIQMVCCNLKSFQIFTDPKRTFLNLKILKQNMVVKVLMKGTTFSIGISSDPKWILN